MKESLLTSINEAVQEAAKALSLKMHVYDFEEGEVFIAARSMDEAKAEYAELYSVDGDELVRELTEEELDSKTVALLDEADCPTSETITMRAQLAEQLAVEGEDEDAFYLCGRE